jgi:hypothetical protein
MAEGKPVYIPEVFLQGYDAIPSSEYSERPPRQYYPPSALIAALPMAVFSYPAAKALCYIASVVVLGGGLWALMAQRAPAWRLESRLLLILIALQCVSVRWCFTMLQMGALATGLFALYYTALLRSRAGWAGAILLVVLCLKATLALPLLAAALVGRQYRQIVLGVLLFALINAIGFARTGGVAAVGDYRRNIAQLEQLPVNDPDPHHPESGERSDWVYLVNAFAPNAPRARRIALALNGVSVGILGMALFQERKRRLCAAAMTLWLSAATCLSLLMVYHHTYDLALLLVPLILLRAAPLELRRRASVRLFQGTLLALCLRPGFHLFAGGLAYLLRGESAVIEKAFSATLLALAFFVLLPVLFALRRIAPDS